MNRSMHFMWMACLLALVLPVAVYSQQKPQGDMPAAAVVEPRYDFGTVPDGTEVVHDFIVQNKGTAPLVIDQIKTG
jgi:hypothetical protein